MRGWGVETVWVMGVCVRGVGVVFAGWVVGDVLLLDFVIVYVTDTVFVIAGVPDVAGELLPNREGKAAFDELKATRGACVNGRSDEDVDVIGHDDEAVKLETTLVAIAGKSLDHEFCVRRALEDAVALMGKDGDSVRVQLLTYRGHVEESIPQGLKPQFCGDLGGPRLKPWGT